MYLMVCPVDPLIGCYWYWSAGIGGLVVVPLSRALGVTGGLVLTSRVSLV